MTLNFYTLGVLYLVYSFLGWVGETVVATFRGKRFANRGMAAGPFCFVYGTTAILMAVGFADMRTKPVALFVACMLTATVVEWLTAKLLERLHNRKWWDYSEVPFNLNGYVCIPFSAAWGAACVFVVKIVHPLICKLVLLVPKWLTIGEDVAFGISIFVDISVTVAAILKFNKRLEKMEEIAAEFHRISDQIGSDIYKSVMEGMERQERIKEQTEARKEELRGMYLELQKRSPRMTTRMLRAFPKMQPRLHKEQFGRLKEFRRSEWLATKALKKARKAAKKNK